MAGFRVKVCQNCSRLGVIRLFNLKLGFVVRV